MRDLAILFLHLIMTIARLFGPDGARSIVAESRPVKHQLLTVNRSREPAPNLRTSDRIIAELCAMLMHPGRILRSAVITEKESVEAYRRSGKFPDGATRVKELRASKSGSFTTGQGVSYATNGIKQWFVMIKDSKNRLAGNPLWGEGWGWALYKPNDPSENTATDFQADCLGCHVPAKDRDWVYTEAYPTLIAD